MDNPSIYRGAVNTVPEWARVPEIVKLFSIGRSSLYSLIKTGAVASRIVKTSKHHVSGIRLVSTDSVRAFIESSAPEAAAPEEQKAAA